MLGNFVVILAQVFFHKRGPIHPGIYVLLDFLVWGLCIPAIVYTIAGGMFWSYAPVAIGVNGTIDCSLFFNQFSMECKPVVYTIGRLELAGIVFLVLIG